MTDQIQDQDVELNEDEEVVEAHDPKNAEAQSVASVDKAGNTTKTATARKGDKKNSEKAEKAPKQESYNFDADLQALVNEEATLSEGFKEKAGIIFEAAVKSTIAEEVDRLEEQYEQQLQEEVDQIKTDMVEKVDGYLNYVVENWMEENKVAIKNGLRAEIAEEFMGKLKDLFTESYIQVPDEKVDLVDDLVEQVQSLESKLNEQTGKMIEMSEELELFQRFEIIREHARDLAETEVEKLVKLAEDLDFVSEEAFSQKVKTIKESYFKGTKTTETIAETFDEETADENVEISESMAQYLTALKKTSK